jgi:phage repressor protein C with HTH and peptisase S24 domain
MKSKLKEKGRKGRKKEKVKKRRKKKKKKKKKINENNKKNKKKEQKKNTNLSEVSRSLSFSKSKKSSLKSSLGQMRCKVSRKFAPRGAELFGNNGGGCSSDWSGEGEGEGRKLE